MRRLQQALAVASRIGAMYEVVSIYRDMSSIFAAQGDGVRAGEMAELAVRHEHLLKAAESELCNLTPPEALPAASDEQRLAKMPFCFQSPMGG